MRISRMYDTTKWIMCSRGSYVYIDHTPGRGFLDALIISCRVHDTWQRQLSKISNKMRFHRHTKVSCTSRISTCNKKNLDPRLRSTPSCPFLGSSCTSHRFHLAIDLLHLLIHAVVLGIFALNFFQLCLQPCHLLPEVLHLLRTKKQGTRSTGGYDESRTRRPNGVGRRVYS